VVFELEAKSQHLLIHSYFETWMQGGHLAEVEARASLVPILRLKILGTSKMTWYLWLQLMQLYEKQGAMTLEIPEILLDVTDQVRGVVANWMVAARGIVEGASPNLY
jgi:hypothetical protein